MVLLLIVYHNRALIALHRIKGETENLIHNFNRPVKTFLEANLDQSRLISRLSALLPSLQPLVAVAEGDYHQTWPVPDYARARHVKEEKLSDAKEDSVRDGDELGALDGERRKMKREFSTVGRNETTCFDRGPRSRSIIPSTNAVADREFRWAAPMSI